MPELEWRYGYFLILFLMALIALLQTFWLWRRGWFETWTASRDEASSCFGAGGSATAVVDRLAAVVDHENARGTSLPVSDPIALFINKLRAEPDLQRKIRDCCSAEQLAAVAESEGFGISGAELVRYFARQLLASDDERATRNFDILSWDVGELLWILKSWEF